MAQLNKKIMAVAVAVVFCLLAAFWPHEREADVLKIEQQAVTASEEEEAKITVYVSGAVANPGLHEIAPGSRAVEAIAAAGGMTEEANKDKVNLAKICKDGMQVNVPRLSAKERRRLAAANTPASSAETAEQNSASYNAAQESGTALMGKVHLNTATAEELETLPGVGAVTAQRIVEYRSAHGFARIEDLMNVKGIGRQSLRKCNPGLIYENMVCGSNRAFCSR